MFHHRSFDMTTRQEKGERKGSGGRRSEETPLFTGDGRDQHGMYRLLCGGKKGHKKGKKKKENFWKIRKEVWVFQKARDGSKRTGGGSRVVGGDWERRRAEFPYGRRIEEKRFGGALQTPASEQKNKKGRE